MRTTSLMLLAFTTIALTTTVARADMPNEDESPPEVSITSPTDQQMFEGAPAKITIAVAADDPDSGVGRVVVSIDGVEQEPLTAAPWTLADVELAEGMHEIVAHAENNDGYGADSATIHVVVFPASGDDGDDADPPVDEDDTNDDDDDDGDEKSGCSVGRERNLMGSGIAFALAVFAGLRLRRRE